MKVQDLMTCDVQCCHPEDDLGRAAQIMWDEDCGIVPVVSSDGGVAGVITDRDVCMAAWSRGLPLSAIRVLETMAREILACSPEDELDAAMLVMRRGRVRRLPVLDEGGILVGILSLNDLAVEADRQEQRGPRQLSLSEVATTLATVSWPRRSKLAQREQEPAEPTAKPIRATSRVSARSES